MLEQCWSTAMVGVVTEQQEQDHTLYKLDVEQVGHCIRLKYQKPKDGASKLSFKKIVQNIFENYFVN